MLTRKFGKEVANYFAGNWTPLHLFSQSNKMAMILIMDKSQALL